MIQVEDLAVSAGNFGLRGVSFEVPRGQYAVLMGRTGSGKTTVLEALCGLKPVTAGRIRLLGRDVTGLKPALRGVGYVPQDRALFPNMTVWEHLAFALRIRQTAPTMIERRVEEMAEILGLEKLLDRKPFGLSGGEAQRVALGRALAHGPSVLLMDEPLSALDDETREEMCELLTAIQERTGVTTLHVTHNVAEARRLADRLLQLRDGVVCVEGQSGGRNGLNVKARPSS